LPTPEPVDVCGGDSGAVPAELVGAMMSVGDRMWADSWLVVPTGVTVQGDSGSAVILDQGQHAATGNRHDRGSLIRAGYKVGYKNGRLLPARQTKGPH
jgi:hypothetical protein